MRLDVANFNSRARPEGSLLAIQTVSPDNLLYRDIPGFEITATQLDRQQPDELLLGLQGDRVLARCGLWLHGPSLPDHRVGVIGHYFAANEEAGVAILQAACNRLAAAGCTLAIGPMDGCTWERYRLITERGSEPIFFLEPDNPDEWPGHFHHAWFWPIAGYCSAMIPLDGPQAWPDEKPNEQIRNAGVHLRAMQMGDFEKELDRIYRLSLECFADNFLFNPISENQFRALYGEARSFIQSELILLAERGDDLIGYLFAVPDLLQRKRGEVTDTAILKTMGVRTDFRGIGLGAHLVSRSHRVMYDLGYKRSIHALFLDTSPAGHIRRQVFRRYSLFACKLEGTP